MSDINCKVLVCCHKQDVCVDGEPYFPIQVGKAVASVDLGIQGDDAGENISASNPGYCELTGMYWAWKNLKDVDVIGLCHYRRYFDFHHQCGMVKPYKSFPSSAFGAVDLSIPDGVIKKAASGQVYIAKPRNYRDNLMVEYCTSHISDDFRVMRQVIKESRSPEIQEAFFQVFYQNNKLSHYNMFLMNWAEFDAYCSWLFPILSEVGKRIDITHYNSVQRRIFGYMAERLLNVWVLARDVKVRKIPVIWFNDADDPMKHHSDLNYAVRSAMNNIAMLLLRHKDHNF